VAVIKNLTSDFENLKISPQLGFFLIMVYTSLIPTGIRIVPVKMFVSALQNV